MFPLGELTKPQVRALAAEHGLRVASKKESQDLCFLAGTGKRAFLAKHARLQDESGEVLDAAGTPVGRHPGHRNFTVGQRKGLGVAAPQPLYVLATDAGRNTITVGTREQLRTHTVPVRDVVLHRPPEEVDQVKLRYRSSPLPCRIDGDEIHLGEPVEGAAPGQVAVLLRGDAVAGHAIIR